MAVQADGGPGFVRKVDVVREPGAVCRAGARVDLLRKPGQLCAVFNFIRAGVHAVAVWLFGFCAVPGGAGLQKHGNVCAFGVNGQGTRCLNIPSGLDGVGIGVVGQRVDAGALRLDGLPVPEDGDFGVNAVGRNSEAHGFDRQLLQLDGHRNSLAADGDLPILHGLVTEGFCGVGIGAVRQLDGPAAVLGQRLPVNGDFGRVRVRNEGHGVCGLLIGENGIAVIDAGFVRHKRCAEGAGEALQRLGGHAGSAAGVGTGSLQEVAAGNAAALLFADDHAVVAAVGDGGLAGGVAVCNGGVGTVEVSCDAARPIAAGGDVRPVVAPVEGQLAVDVPGDAARVVAGGTDFRQVRAVAHRVF